LAVQPSDLGKLLVIAINAKGFDAIFNTTLPHRKAKDDQGERLAALRYVSREERQPRRSPLACSGAYIYPKHLVFASWSLGNIRNFQFQWD